jgi:hypothetical protein
MAEEAVEFWCTVAADVTAVCRISTFEEEPVLRPLNETLQWNKVKAVPLQESRPEPILLSCALAISGRKLESDMLNSNTRG